MTKRTRALAALATVLAAAAIASPAASAASHVTVLSSGDVDYLDPGQTFYTYGYQILYSTQRALYYFAPSAPSTQIPDLAAASPEIAPDRKSLRVQLRRGVRFSPPVGREVTAADVEYAIERAFSANVPNSYAVSYFGEIVGAPRTPTSRVRDIAGVRAVGSHTLQIDLRTPTAGQLAAALVMPITVPVPREYAAKFDARRPSTYDANVAFSGPYMVRNNAAGRLTGWKPGRSMAVVRNPNWDRSTDFRPAHLDSWSVQMGNDDSVLASQRILRGQGLVQGDTPPPDGVLREAARQYKDQLVISPSGGTRYVAVNTRQAPFDDVNVRRALIAAFDRTAMRRTRGGALVGDVAWGFLPPGFPGHAESGGLRPPREFDYLRKPAGDLALARRYMRKAGYRSGRYSGKRRILTIATDASPGRDTARVAAAQFAKLGFTLRVRVVPQDVLYTRYCGVPSSNYGICMNVGFFKDFLDGQSLLDTTFSGDQIFANNNYNWPLIDDPKINGLIRTAKALPSGAGRDRAWAAVNLELVRKAVAIPWLWDKQPIIASRNVNLVADDYANSPFMAFLSLK